MGEGMGEWKKKVVDGGDVDGKRARSGFWWYGKSGSAVAGERCVGNCGGGDGGQKSSGSGSILNDFRCSGVSPYFMTASRCAFVGYPKFLSHPYWGYCSAAFLM